MDKDSDINRRKFMEVGIFAITGSIAAVSTAALARFAVAHHLEKRKCENDVRP